MDVEDYITITICTHGKAKMHSTNYFSAFISVADYAAKNQIPSADMDARRAALFSKGQACLRSSPLGKRYGWGIHYDARARVALYPQESDEYRRLSQDPSLKQVKAMKSAR